METNRDRQAKFNIQQHLEKRRREKPQFYQGALIDVSLRQKKSIANAGAFPQMSDIDELPAGLTCGKCKGTCDKLVTQFHANHPMQLCDSCCEHKGKPITRENKFQQDLLVGGTMTQYKRQYVCDKQIIIFATSRKSNTQQTHQQHPTNVTWKLHKPTRVHSTIKVSLVHYLNLPPWHNQVNYKSKVSLFPNTICKYSHQPSNTHANTSTNNSNRKTALTEQRCLEVTVRSERNVLPVCADMWVTKFK